MANVTVRNIPDSILEQIKALSAIERRSMNNEIVILLEEAVRSRQTLSDRLNGAGMSPEAQFEAWERLIGAWEDERSAQEIVADIYSRRSPGRSIDL
ncbi:MAG: FitA-like ribbon-helix-helix domain-containing protein [Spirochaetales bacterium]